MSKTTTFADIAEYTGYSKTTISRYFNKPDTLSEHTKQIISNALKELNYKENKLARSLATGKSEFIGIIIPNTYMDYYSEILNLILDSYKKTPYKFLIFQGGGNPEAEIDYIRELMAYKILGLIVLSHAIPSEEFSKLKIPTVLFEREYENADSVNLNNDSGGRMAAKHLIDSGSDVLIHINSNVKVENPTYSRISGFRKESEKYGKVPRFYFGHFGNSHATARHEMNRIFEQIERDYPGDETLGIFLSNDTFASIFLNLVVAKYKTLPDKYKIIGFDNTKASYEAIFPITTVAQPKEEMVEKAMELLSRRIEENNSQSKKSPAKEEHFFAEPYLIVRETTKK